MGSRDRFLAALNGERPDRTPLAHISALTTVELQEITGCHMPEVHSDPEQLARLCAANHDVLGFDAVSFIINFFGEPAALGCEMDWGAKNRLPMYLSHPWAQPEDAVVPGDILDRKPVRDYLQTLRIAKRDCRGRMAVLGKVMGPFSMVQVMHGVENVMMAVLDEPEKVKHFLNTASQVLIKCANAQFESGADAVAIGEGGAGSNMLSPDLHEEFLLEVHQRMVREIHGPLILHICGDITPRLDLLARTGITCFNFDWSISPRRMKEASHGMFRVMGNVNTADLLHGSPQEIRRQVRDCLDAGVDIISPGCAVSPECLNVNLKAMSEATLHMDA